jgi:uncharacterized protein (TIGR02147 family)
MAQNSIYDFLDYKAYLRKVLEDRAAVQKGQRSKLAQAIGCQPAYLSQVLNGSNDLSPEQAQSTNQFLAHTPADSRYFLNMVLWARAGTQDLKAYYHEELKKQQREWVVLKNRVKATRVLGEADQARYYSAWYYAAIHVVVSLGTIRTKDKIARALQLPEKTVNEILEFLVQIGVLKIQGKEYRQGETSLYLGSDSPFIHQHHTNWRMKALQSLDQKEEGDLHYSGVITCSLEDAKKIQEIMIQTVQKIRATVKDSKDETLYAYTLDCFGLMTGKNEASKI